MGILFLSYLGSFDAKQASVIPLGIKITQERVSSSTESSETVVIAPSRESSSVSSESAPVPVQPSLSTVVESQPRGTPAPSPAPQKKPSPVTVEAPRPAAPPAPEQAVDAVSSSISSSAVQESSSSASSEKAQASSLSSSEASSSVPQATSSSVSSKSSSVPDAKVEASDFPAFDHTSFPVAKVPNWGAMRVPQEWNRWYSEMQPADFVSIPSYNAARQTTPMESLIHPVTNDTIPIVTEKLFYSTDYLGKYDVDAGIGSGEHRGVDLKLARRTPIGSIAGGRVASVTSDDLLGLHVIIEHRLKTGETYYSIYAHFDKASVSAGQDVRPGQIVGSVGMTGTTSGPHLHLQVDRGQPGGKHTPSNVGDPADLMVNPLTFIAKYRNGE